MRSAWFTLFCSVGLALAFFAGPAVGASSSAAPASAECQLPSAADGSLAPAALQQRIYARLPACQNDPRWLARAGQLLLGAGLPVPAIDFLERALLLDETLREAQLDYALALAGAGETQSAGNLVRSLLDEPGLPAHLRNSLASTLRTLASSAGLSNGTGRHRLAASVRAGHDSNLLGAPDLRFYSLSVGGALIPFALPPTYQAQPGSYLRSDLEWAYDSGPAENRWQLWANARDRRSFSVQEAGLQQVSVGTELWRGPWYVNLETSQADAQVGLRFRNNAVGAGIGLPVSVAGWSCLARAGLQGQLREVTSDPVLSGRYAGVVGQALCSRLSSSAPGDPVELPALRWIDAWMAELRLGRDHPQDTQRPGGQQAERALRLVLLGSASSLNGSSRPQAEAALNGSRWLLELDYVHRTDDSPYSPVLGGDARRLNTLAARAEWQVKLTSAPAWRLQFGYQLLQRKANIALFGMAGHGPYAGLSRVW